MANKQKEGMTVAVHIFAVSEENYKVCVERGLVAIPEAKEGPRHDNIVDGLLSRLCGIKEDDYVLLRVKRSEDQHVSKNGALKLG